ncbi:MAG: methylmalonyl-CoA mutase family protein [bacterium]
MFDPQKLEKLSKSRKEYEDKTLGKTLERYAERRQKFVNGSGDEIDRLYTPLDMGEIDYEAKLGFPGQYPFTRGVQPSMYRGRFWTMRQYAGFGTARESNERYKYLLRQGQMGLSVAFDLCTQIGYDSDHPMSRGEVGKVGVAIDSLEDMEILLDGIPLDKVSTSMTMNAPASVLLAMYIAVGENQGVPRQRLSGTVQNDILKEYVSRGTYIYPPKHSMRLVTDTFAFCSKEVPRWNFISISGYHIREAGATAAQEIGFTLANAIAYVEAALENGLKIDEFAPRISFFFNAHNDLLEEVAKFRAARRMWAKIMKARFGAKDPRSMMLRFHTQTAGSTLTAQQPENNVARVTIQTLAAVLGGTQSLHTNSRDEALALPTEETALIALRTQQIVAHESGVVETIDPLGGSFYVEALTDRLEREAMNYIERIDEMGGAVAAIESGYMQKEIQNSAYRHQIDVEKKERIIVGVNEYVLEDEPETEILHIDPSVEEEQLARLQALKKRRDAGKVGKTLDNLRSAAEGSDNLMPHILDAVKVYATLGEICGILREVFGEYRETVVL